MFLHVSSKSAPFITCVVPVWVWVVADPTNGISWMAGYLPRLNKVELNSSNSIEFNLKLGQLNIWIQSTTYRTTRYYKNKQTYRGILSNWWMHPYLLAVQLIALKNIELSADLVILLNLNLWFQGPFLDVSVYAFKAFVNWPSWLFPAPDAPQLMV